MAHLAALLLFAALSAACWLVSAALYRGTTGAPPLSSRPGHSATMALAVGAAALTSFVQFPLGYALGCAAYAAAAFGGLGLPPGRAAVLFLYLAAASLAARLLVLGVVVMFRL